MIGMIVSQPNSRKCEAAALERAQLQDDMKSQDQAATQLHIDHSMQPDSGVS